MSYSRFGPGCKWYTYWSGIRDGMEDNRENQVFVVTGSKVTEFTYKELSENINKCLLEVFEKEGHEEIDNLKGDMIWFLNDMKKRFPEETI